MTTEPATVMVVDDHLLFREGLVALIGRWPDFRVVGKAADGRKAVELAAKLRPDLVLMDVRMSGMDGLDATRAITSANPKCRVVMLTMSSLGDDVLQALRNGAHGYLSKDEPPERLRAFLVGVMRGEAALSGPIAAKVLASFGPGAPSPRGPDAIAAESLTKRERDVLKLLVDGLSNEEIAAALFITEATVKKHIGRVMAKWRMKNRVQVAVHSVRQGLVD
ncbi:MAG: response regulator transcription factor [Bifidobacteriaceae bacterium]|jgi:DNA-binding NarL/FixJ family response regulator|nr:response regulator transcription factor [Bifidobacteriaceae bacterium]